jgi:hypothetical protein
MNSNQPAVLGQSSRCIWLAEKLAAIGSASTFFTIYRNELGEFITHIIT